MIIFSSIAQIVEPNINWPLVLLVVSIIINLIQAFWKEFIKGGEVQKKSRDLEIENLKKHHDREINELKKDLFVREKNIDDKLSEILKGISDLSKFQAVSSQKTQEAFDKIHNLVSDVKDIEDDVKMLRDRIITIEEKIKQVIS